MSNSQDITSPEEFLGYKVGTDRKLADWPEIVEYFMKVAEQSPRVLVENLGETTEGNPFIVATVSSQSNLSELEKLRQIQLKLCNPEGLSDEEAEELVRAGKTVVLISCSIHSTEVGGSQMSMELLHSLASSNEENVREILNNVILLLVPSLNPDGNRIVVDWYEKYLGTLYEGTSPPWLYQKYAGHDNNRDWYMFNLKETQLTVKYIHNRWHPQIVYDLHQMGQTGPRFYVPPFIDPMEPNIDPVIVSGVNFMGLSMADALALKGKRGVAVHWVFDGWTPARAYQHYHGGIRILSEAASAMIASPVDITREELVPSRGFNPLERRWNHPLPWEGGKWTLRDIIDYEIIAATACLETAAKSRERWVRGSLEIGKRALAPNEEVYAYVIPPEQRDHGAVMELLWVLKMGDVVVHRTLEPFTVDGVEYSEGSYVVLVSQAYGRFAKAMLERQIYPDLRENPDTPPKVPYDVTAHTLGLQLAVDVVTVKNQFNANLEVVDELMIQPGKIVNETSPWFVLSPVPNYSVKAVNRLLNEGYAVSRCILDMEITGEIVKPGAFIVESKTGILKQLNQLSIEYGLSFYGIDECPDEVFNLNDTRIGIYCAWVPNADEGWLRMVLEEYGFGFEVLSPQDIRQGGLAEKFDVVIFPDLGRDIIVKGMSEHRYFDPSKYEPFYRIGLGEEGTREILRFLNKGGNVVTLNRAGEFAVKDLWAGAELALEELSDKEFYCPGSLLRVLVDNTHPIGFGFDREETIMFLHSPCYKVHDGCMVAWYPEADPLLSGWILGEEHLHGLAAVAEVNAGLGRIILVGCTPHFRNQTRGTFKLLFNSILYTNL